MYAARAASAESPTRAVHGVPCRDTELFVEPPDDCRCPMGKGVMTDPQVIQIDGCEHEFCSGCIRGVMQTERSECPQCQQPFTLRDLRGVRKARLRVLDFPSHCDNRGQGCEWEGKYGMMDMHLRECEFATVYRCPFWHYGCGYNGPSADVDHHLLTVAQDHLRMTCQRLEAYGDVGEFAQSPNEDPVVKVEGGLTDEQAQYFKDLIVKAHCEKIEVSDIAEGFRERWSDKAWSVLRCLKADNQQYIQSLALMEVAFGFYTWTLIGHQLND
eukprot:Hpha_TRINITY_DN19208_c0_g1::TRINITY_DN19208_c0_g1_i1::g.194422::m.194422